LGVLLAYRYGGKRCFPLLLAFLSFFHCYKVLYVVAKVVICLVIAIYYAFYCDLLQL
jgi:hypothetical protein